MALVFLLMGENGGARIALPPGIDFGLSEDLFALHSSRTSTLSLSLRVLYHQRARRSFQVSLL
jgi:hypothetical protein